MIEGGNHDAAANPRSQKLNVCEWVGCSWLYYIGAIAGCVHLYVVNKPIFTSFLTIHAC